MAYSISTQVIGLTELQRAFKASPRIFNEEMKDALNLTAYHVEGKAKFYAPVRRGGLRGSINTQTARGSGDTLEAKVGTNLHYAPYQEFGTGIYGKEGKMITPKRKKLLMWKDGGKWHFAKAVRGVKPKFYFKKAKTESIPFLDRAVRTAVQNITHRIARY